MIELSELKDHFAGMSIEKIESESKKLYLEGNNLLFAASIIILCNSVSEWELNNFIITLQE